MESYACEKQATTREHVPPKSFFPKNYRKDLITIPSCEEHNIGKSGDDEYLRAVFATGFRANPIERLSILPKIIRSTNYAPSKNYFYRNLRFVKYAGIQTSMFDVNIERIRKILHLILLGIHFYHIEYRWTKEIEIALSPQFVDTSKNSKYNEAVFVMQKKLLSHFAKLSRYGKNPEIFFYQYLKFDFGKHFRLVFYDSISIDGIFWDYRPDDDWSIYSLP